MAKGKGKKAQRSAPLLFITIMDVFAWELESKPPASMLFADDLVVCETLREKQEQGL